MPERQPQLRCLLTDQAVEPWMQCVAHLVRPETDDAGKTRWIPVTPAFRAHVSSKGSIDDTEENDLFDRYMGALAPVTPQDGIYRELDMHRCMYWAARNAQDGTLFLRDGTDPDRLVPVRVALMEKHWYQDALEQAERMPETAGDAVMEPLLARAATEHWMDADRVGAVRLITRYLTAEGKSWAPDDEPKAHRAMRAKRVPSRSKDTGSPLDGWKTVMDTPDRLVLVKSTETYELRLERDPGHDADTVHGCLMYGDTFGGQFTQVRPGMRQMNARTAREWATYMARAKFEAFELAARDAVRMLNVETGKE